ncbi:AAA family ATPase [Acanthopleuribacter pedis]|uniref:AAA family ATPase n=2 Tax=Acanthopleuribacter pedis TaxID=442870 RepID=A0A8J7U678_9BACT|nr:AAA family ATPase [Acanthopleuribacter pedis]
MMEIRKVIVGQRYMLDRLMIGMITGGHVLMEGVPGLAKTLSVNTMANTLDMSFKRIQFTPDLLPADILGTLIYNQKDGTFEPKKGPVFANLVLADEINRAPAKVQSALLEAMQEKQVTIGDTTYPLPKPFLVLATQNPIEQEGTYRLPEAQVDRFMLKLNVGYPSKAEERDIMDRFTSGGKIETNTMATPQDVFTAREVVGEIYVDDRIRDYIIELIFATREPANHGLAKLTELIDFGASPRASIALLNAARAHAFIRGRGYVIPEDVKAIGFDILRHRVGLTFEAEAENVTSEEVIQTLFDEVEVP